jgi:hypothetical protein
MARLTPRKASEAPTGWLTFSGLTASALLRLMMSAMAGNANQTGCCLCRKPHATKNAFYFIALFHLSL